MSDYKELIEHIRQSAQSRKHFCISRGTSITPHYIRFMFEAADAIEQLVKERDYIPTDTLRKYHAWLLEKFCENPTSEKLHSIDTAISWLKAYGEYKDINVCFGVQEVEHETD